MNPLSNGFCFRVFAILANKISLKTVYTERHKCVNTHYNLKFSITNNILLTQK